MAKFWNSDRIKLLTGSVSSKELKEQKKNLVEIDNFNTIQCKSSYQTVKITSVKVPKEHRDPIAAALQFPQLW